MYKYILGLFAPLKKGYVFGMFACVFLCLFLFLCVNNKHQTPIDISRSYSYTLATKIQINKSMCT